ncbi:MAG: hypothetical protein WCD49_05235 [Candidatus Acidiferrales bacterium]
MFSRWAYILIGQDRTGKTSFQKNLIFYLCNERKRRLDTDIVTDITHPRAPKNLLTIFTCNRSYQEKLKQYKSIDNYFKRFFKEADICVLSSHTSHKSAQHVAEMIRKLKRRCYNVAGVFWSNAYDQNAREIALLPWNEVLWIENPILTGDEQIAAQLDQIALHFAEFLIARAIIQ